MNPFSQLAITLAVSASIGALLGSIGTSPEPPPDPPAPAAVESPPPAPTSPAAALASIRDSELPSHYESTTGKERDLVARFWSRAAPAEFLVHLSPADSPLFTDPAHALHLFESWAADDFGAAYQAALGLSPFNPLRSHVLHRVVAKHFGADPAAAIAALDQVWANNGSAASHIVYYLETPEESLEHLARLPRTDVANSAMARCLTGWAKTSPDAALTWAQQNHVRTWPVLLATWKTSPDTATRLLPRVISLRERSEAARSLAARHLHPASPELSVALIDDQLDGSSRTGAAAELAAKLAARDPKDASAIALTFGSPAARTAALTTALAIFDRDAPRSLDHWVSSLPESASTGWIRSALQDVRRPATPPKGKPASPAPHSPAE